MVWTKWPVIVPEALSALFVALGVLGASRWAAGTRALIGRLEAALDHRHGALRRRARARMPARAGAVLLPRGARGRLADDRRTAHRAHRHLQSRR